MPRKPTEQKIAQLQAQLADLKARASKEARSIETRRKIVLGAAVENAMEADTELKARVVSILREKVTRPIDQKAVEKWLTST